MVCVNLFWFGGKHACGKCYFEASTCVNESVADTRKISACPLALLVTMVRKFAWEGDWCGLQSKMNFFKCQLFMIFHEEFALRTSIITLRGLRGV